MRKNYRVKSEKDFNAIFKSGQSFANRKFVVYMLEKEQKHFRVGISVSKKLGMQWFVIVLKEKSAMS